MPNAARKQVSTKHVAYRGKQNETPVGLRIPKHIRLAGQAPPHLNDGQHLVWLAAFLPGVKTLLHSSHRTTLVVKVELTTFHRGGD